MDNRLIGFPQNIVRFLDGDDVDTKNYFLSLSEDKQLELIRKSNTSSESLHDCIEDLKLKE